MENCRKQSAHFFLEPSINKVKHTNFSNLRADNTHQSGLIKLISDLMVIYILTMFGADWLIFVNARG